MPGPNSTPAMTPQIKQHRFLRLPREIWVLGFVSLLMDSSSELVHSLLPMFMGTVLGASMLTIGMIEGVAEATASITKVFSGALSDYFRKRKPLVVLGYGLGALTKPVFPLATSIGWVFGARFVDRIGKGIRGAPRDALVTEIVRPEQRGAAFGLRQALDSVGAFIGPLLAVLFMALFADDIGAVLWIAVIPAFLAVLLLFTGVHEPDPAPDAAGGKRHLTFADAKLLSTRYWFVVALGAVFTLARFSEAFLVLRAQDVGLGMGYVPAIMIVMNLVYSALAYPAGIASDRFSPRILLVIGLVVLIAADLMLAMAVSPLAAYFGAGFWGLHMALTQGLLSKLVADTAPSDLRGTAFGVFNLVAGVMLLIASATAGALWNSFGASATFGAGALFASVAAIGLLLYHPR